MFLISTIFCYLATDCRVDNLLPVYIFTHIPSVHDWSCDMLTGIITDTELKLSYGKRPLWFENAVSNQHALVCGCSLCVTAVWYYYCSRILPDLFLPSDLKRHPHGSAVTVVHSTGSQLCNCSLSASALMHHYLCSALCALHLQIFYWPILFTAKPTDDGADSDGGGNAD